MNIEIKNILNNENINCFSILNWSKIKFRSTNIEEKHYNFSSKINGYPENLYKIILKLVKTCNKEDGIGLAAPQVGVYKNIIVCIDLQAPAYNVYLNPKITPLIEYGESIQTEHCLSVPNKGFDIKRWNKIQLNWQEFNIEGKLINFNNEFEGLMARVIQHEYDHLLNISIPQR